MISRHLSRIRSHSRKDHRLDHGMSQSLSRRECLKDRGRGMAEVHNYWLVTQRKSLESIEPWRWLRWALRKYFEWRGFACRAHCGNCDGKCYASVEYRGVFDNEAAARFAASCEGGEYKPIPFNAALPEETVSYLTGDAPLSEASPWYRRGAMLPFVSLPRDLFNQLDDKTKQTLDCAHGRCNKRVV